MLLLSLRLTSRILLLSILKPLPACKAASLVEVGELSLEGLHDLTGVVGDDALEGGDGTLDSTLRKETEYSNHGEAAVVDLGDEAVGLGEERSDEWEVIRNSGRGVEGQAIAVASLQPFLTFFSSDMFLESPKGS